MRALHFLNLFQSRVCLEKQDEKITGKLLAQSQYYCMDKRCVLKFTFIFFIPIFLRILSR